ncbi:MAG: prepilin-type N-terminal cleavage/methylation domain-containing protein [bacterium]|nr:prepilin-type N-terminal cleavage/methylation domain-containing protein [bacterium]
MKPERGFTIVEVITAFFLVSMGILGAFALIEKVATGTAASLSRLTAASLVKEGIEITRNMRDSNLLKLNQGQGGAWNDGLTSCAAGCEIDYNDASFSPYGGTFLKSTGTFYAYDSGQDTKFQRKITITPLTPYMVSVVVDVFWTERGRNLSFEAATQLFNWYSF